MNRKILIADDDGDILTALALLMKSEGHSVNAVQSPAQVLELLKVQDFDLILLDLNFSKDTTSGDEGVALIQAIRKNDDLTPIVVMTGWGTIDIAVAAMRCGANDFVQKPWENERLISIVNTQFKLTQMLREQDRLKSHNTLLQSSDGDELVSSSPLMQQCLVTLRQVAASDASVLLTGENGVGKSLFAHYLHKCSTRSEKRFVAVNMGAIPDSLFESEMFGHVQGAFTDAKKNRVGRFEMADGGTLFLDEIANTGVAQQAKLLRVLEEKKFEKVGSSKTQYCDVRMVSATNADIFTLIKKADFRQDLLYRLNTIEIHIPALRERREDIIPMANYFLRKHASRYLRAAPALTIEAQNRLLDYSWPGNVRELSHVIERAIIMCPDKMLYGSHLNLPNVKQHTAEPSYISREFSADLTLTQLEQRWLKQRLDHYNGNANQAAESLGLSRSAFYRRLGKYKN